VTEAGPWWAKMAPTRRTAALVISAFVEPRGNPPWYARISSYDDAFAPAVQTTAQSTVDGVCEAVRAWLESVIGEDANTADGSVTAR
jgi:hypothetical protein